MFKFLVAGGRKHTPLLWGEVARIGCLTYDTDGLEGSRAFEGLLEAPVGGSAVRGLHGGTITERRTE